MPGAKVEKNQNNISILIGLLRTNPFNQKSFEKELNRLKEDGDFDINEGYVQEDGVITTILYEASGVDKIDAVNALIIAGAGVNIKRVDQQGSGDTPFYIAALLDKKDICKALLEEGAKLPEEFEFTTAITQSLVECAMLIREGKLKKQEELLTNWGTVGQLNKESDKAIGWLMEVDRLIAKPNYLLLPKSLDPSLFENNKDFVAYKVGLEKICGFIEDSKNIDSPMPSASKAQASNYPSLPNVKQR